MIMTRREIITLPQSEDGRFMAERYQKDMVNAGMKIQRDDTTLAIKIEGVFIGDLPDEFIAKIKVNENKQLKGL